MNALHQVVMGLLALTSGVLAGVTLRNAVVELRTKVARPSTTGVAVLCIVCSLATVFMGLA